MVFGFGRGLSASSPPSDLFQRSRKSACKKISIILTKKDFENLSFRDLKFSRS